MSGRSPAALGIDVTQSMKPNWNQNVGVPKLGWVLIAAAICLIAVVSLVNVDRSPQVTATAQSARLQAAPTTIQPPIVPIPSQANQSSFPPRSDLGTGSGQASAGEAVPGVGWLGFPPSSAPVLGPPSFTGKPEAKRPNSAGVMGTPVQGQMRVVSPSASDKMIVQLPRSTEMAGVVLLHGVPGP